MISIAFTDWENQNQTNPVLSLSNLHATTSEVKSFPVKKPFKGSNISLTENLTQKRVDILNEARNKHGFKNVWIADGKILYVGDDDKIKNYIE